MASDFPKELVLSSSCVHPSPVYRRNFFVLRLPISANGQPTLIKGPDTRPVLYSSVLDTNVEVAKVVKMASATLARYNISHTSTFFDKTCPFLAIEFSLQETCQHVASLFSETDTISSQICNEIEPLLREGYRGSSPTQVKVEMELYLCCPARDDNDSSKLYRMSSSSNVRFYIDALEGTAMFNFQPLVESANSGAEFEQAGAFLEPPTTKEVKFVDLLRELSKAFVLWFSIGAYLGVPMYKLKFWKCQYHNSPMECLKDMIIWIDDNMHITWADVVKAMCQVDRKAQALDICSKYGVTVPKSLAEISLQESALAKVEEQQQLAPEARFSAEDVQKAIKNLVDNNYLVLEKEVQLLADLKHQTEILQKQLETEQREQSAAPGDDQTSKTEKQQKAMEELKKQLASKKQEYQDAKQQLRTLIADLSVKTSELERKSSALRKLEETQIQDESERQAKQRMKNDQFQLDLARENDHNMYLAEIELQIELEQERISTLIRRINNLRKDLPKRESQTSSLRESLEEKRQEMLENKESHLTLDVEEDGEELLIELQIEVTKMNIDLVDMQSQYALEKIRLKSMQQELEQRMISLETKKNLLPDLSKCCVEGLNLPVNEVEVDHLQEFKVQLQDGDSKLCTGQHIVTVHGPNKETVVAKPHSTNHGIYTLAYTPRQPGKQILWVSIKDISMNHDSMKILVLNTLHLPSSTVSGEGTKSAIKNRVASVNVQLLDEAGHPVSSEQQISARLSHQGEDCLVLPSYATATDSQGDYVLSFLPRTSGECDLTIMANRQPIAKPTKVTVKESAYTPLTGAARDGHLGFIQQLLDKGVNINEKDENGNTALHQTAYGGHVDAVDLLVKNGAKANSQNDDSWTPLMLAAMNGHTTTVQTLMQHHADINAKDEVGNTALHAAVHGDHLDTVDLLVKNGAKVNSQNKNSWTPLMLAAVYGHITTVQTLIEQGADVNAKNKGSRTALDYAISLGRTAIVEYLKSVQQTIIV